MAPPASDRARPVTDRVPVPALPSPVLAWLMLCGLLSGITFAQQLISPLPAGWWIWALVPLAVLVTTFLLKKTRGSRLFATSVLLTLGWVFGVLLRLAAWAALTVMLTTTTG